MKIILINAAGTRTEHECETFEQAIGAIGSPYRVICDGRAGIIRFVGPDSTMAEFVETEEDFRYFQFDHLPDHLKSVSRRFYEIAEWMVLALPASRQRTFSIQQLIVSKDAAVRARLMN